MTKSYIILRPEYENYQSVRSLRIFYAFETVLFVFVSTRSNNSVGVYRQFVSTDNRLNL